MTPSFEPAPEEVPQPLPPKHRQKSPHKNGADFCLCAWERAQT